MSLVSCEERSQSRVEAVLLLILPRFPPSNHSDQDMCGVTADGAFAEYMAADYRSCVRLPDSLAFDAAAPLFCAGATIYST